MRARVRCWAILPAAGTGRRFGSGIPKQHRRVAGDTVLGHSLRLLLEQPMIDAVVLVLAAADQWWPASGAVGNRLLRAEGGAQRSDSVRNALETLHGAAADRDWVLVHDAARPCLRRADLRTLLRDLWQDPVGGLLAVPARDTIKRCDGGGRVQETLDRTSLWQAQTPQMFRFGLLRAALEHASGKDIAITDEASAIEAMGHRPRLLQGSADNIKITSPEDLIFAECILGRRSGEA